MSQTLKEWFNESELNYQAIYDARNGRRYIYKRDQKLSKFAQKLYVEQVVPLENSNLYGAWLY